MRSGKIELLDTIARAHQLLLTLTGDASLRDFAFVTEWPSLDEPTRRARYSAYACHELNLFLWRKDPTFLTSVVRPYLAQRRDKTFVDRFLFGEDLCAFLEPWAFGKLSRRRWRASTHAWFRGSRAEASCATSTPRTRCRLRARAKP